MQVKSTAECSKASILQYIQPYIKLPFVIKIFVLSIFEWPFTQVLLYGFTHFNAPLQLPLKLKRCKPHKNTCHPKKCDVINGDKLFQYYVILSDFMLQNQVY